MPADRPQPGDLLIERVSHWASVSVVGRDEENPQFTSHTFSDALEYALREASRLHVAVWITRNTECDRLASYREASE